MEHSDHCLVDSKLSLGLLDAHSQSKFVQEIYNLLL
jgi:hypothetical protein